MLTDYGFRFRLIKRYQRRFLIKPLLPKKKPIKFLVSLNIKIAFEFKLKLCALILIKSLKLDMAAPQSDPKQKQAADAI